MKDISDFNDALFGELAYLLDIWVSKPGERSARADMGICMVVDHLRLANDWGDYNVFDNALDFFADEGFEELEDVLLEWTTSHSRYMTIEQYV